MIDILTKLSDKEKRIIFGLFALAFISVLVLIFPNSSDNKPSFGGKYKEGIVGSPRYINPILAANNDADLDLAEILFASLAKDLSESVRLSDDKKIYTLKLKSDIIWHDGEPVTADDVLFTVQAIQDPAYQSPLRFNFQGVGIEKIDEKTVKFSLKDVYSPFISTLDIGILPSHIWEEISPAGFALAEANIKPIGNGPFKFTELKKDKNGRITEVKLESFQKRSFIKEIEFKFYSNEEELLSAFSKKEVDAVNYISPKNLDQLDLQIYKIKIPRYFALFFNTEKIKKEDRKALAGEINRDKIIEEVLLKYGQKFGPDYDKLPISNDKLQITITTTNWPELEKTAELIKKMWPIKTNINIIPSHEIQAEVIRERDYEVLLFGEILGSDPDPFAFWHSSQKKHPGLNLSLYDNSKADKLLVEARQEFNKDKRKEIYKEFYDLLNQDSPAVFLYNPTYLYGVSKKVKGIKLDTIGLPAKRFADIENWYIK